jgi:hypothetical protein
MVTEKVEDYLVVFRRITLTPRDELEEEYEPDVGFNTVVILTAP